MPGARARRANSGGPRPLRQQQGSPPRPTLRFGPWTYNSTALAAMNAGSAVPSMTIKIPSTNWCFVISYYACGADSASQTHYPSRYGSTSKRTNGLKRREMHCCSS